MRQKKFTVLFIFWLLVFNCANAQDTTKIKPPVSVEFLAGNNRLFSQINFNKPITENRKLGFLNVSAFATDYENNFSNSEYLNFSALYYKIAKGFSVNAGATFNTAEGLKPLIGLQYAYADKNFSILCLPAYYFSHSYKIFNLLIVEYRPKIKKQWYAYSKLQANYQYDIENNSHFRSFLYLRLGASYKNFTFGAGANLDRYGAKKLFKENYGLFVKLNL